MCRYAFHNYRDHFACFDCRKSFKYWQWEECNETTWQAKRKIYHVPREIICPDCSKPMVDMGLDFKAPKKEKKEEWEVLRLLAESGITFHNCGCLVGFSPPKKLKDVPKFLAEHKSSNAGVRLLQKIQKK